MEDRLQVVACYKRPSEAEANCWVCSDYFATDWLAAESQRAAMPVALNLGGLYEQLLHALVPLTQRPNESLPDLIERVSKVRTLQKEMEGAVSRLAMEKQFNRKSASRLALLGGLCVLTTATHPPMIRVSIVYV